MPFAAPLLALLLLAPAGRVADGADPLLDDDIRFAESLARFRYFDLAFDVLEGVRQHATDPLQKGTVELADADINRRASEATTDLERALLWQSRAIDRLEEWTRPGSPWEHHPRLVDALKELSDLRAARGRLRVLQAQGAEASEVQTLRGLADTDLARSQETRLRLQRACDEQAAACDEQGRDDEAASLRQQSVQTLYDRALVAIDRAELGGDRGALLAQAYDLLSDYQWALPEESIAHVFALHYQGVAKQRLGAADDALALQREVLERGRWFWDNRLGDPAIAPFVVELFDRAWGEIAKLQAAQGAVQDAAATIAGMLAEHARGKLPYGRPGLAVLLDWARQLQDLHRNPEALEIVKLVADQGAATPEGETARSLLATLVAGTSPGAAGDAPAGVLLAAARALLDRGEDAEAAFVFTRAVAAIASDQERRDVLVSAWLGAGRACQSDGRYLLAALAFEHALDAALAQQADAAVTESAAVGMYNNLDRRFRETGDAFDRTLRDEAGDRLLRLGIAADLAFFRARELFDDAAARSPPDAEAFAAALQALRAVAPDAPSHDIADVYAARALAGSGRTEEALAAFDAVRRRVADADDAPADAEARARQQIALGQALYYEADLLLSDKVARPADALALLAGFEEHLPGQQGLVENVKFQRVAAFCLLGDVDAAANAVQELQRFRADSPLLRVAWFRLSEVLRRASDAARARAARDARSDQAAADELLRRAADALWTSAELGGFPSFVNLLSTGDWYLRAGQPDLAQRSYARALEVFDKEGSSVPPEQLDDARLGLAEACNAGRAFAKAQPLWQDLVTRRPNDARVLTGAARGFGGWLEIDPEGGVVEVSGSGDFDAAFTLWTRLALSAQTTSRYERNWWEARLGTIYARYRDGAAHPASLAEARALLDNMALQFPEYDDETRKGLPPGRSYAPGFKPLFKYLEQRMGAR